MTNFVGVPENLQLCDPFVLNVRNTINQNQKKKKNITISSLTSNFLIPMNMTFIKFHLTEYQIKYMTSNGVSKLLLYSLK